MQEFAVPKEFPSLLKAFTRECLRAQPSNIYEFGAQYFAELQAQQEAAAAGDTGPKRLSPAELQELLSNMFHEADADGSGALSLSEFKEVLQMADLGLSERESKYLLAEADMDGNGEISYEEFKNMECWKIPDTTVRRPPPKRQADAASSSGES